MPEEKSRERRGSGGRARLGQTIAEVIIAVALGVFMIIAAVSVIAPTLRMNQAAQRLQTAASLGQELLARVGVFAGTDWHGIEALATSSANQYYIAATSSPFTVTAGTESVVVATTTYTRSFYVDEVERDANGDVVASGGTVDPSTRKVTVTFGYGAYTNTLTDFVTRSRNLVYTQTDWSAGSCQNGPLPYVNAAYASSTNILFASPAGSLVVSISGGTNPGPASSTALGLVWQATTTIGAYPEFMGYIAVDSQYVYGLGLRVYGSPAVLKKLQRSNGALTWATDTTITGSNYTTAIGGVAVDSSSMIYAGGESSAQKWVIEKRNSSGVLQFSTSSGSAGDDNLSGMYDLLVNNGYLYVSGTSGPSSTRSWRIEKRRTSDGALCTAAACGTAFGTNGVLNFGHASWYDIPIMTIDPLTGYLYAVGPTSSVLKVVKLASTTGAVLSSATGPSNFSYYFDISYGTSSDGLYLTGVGVGCNCEWRTARLVSSTGAVVWSTTSTWTGGTADYAYGVTANANSVFISGQTDRAGASPGWRIEQRQASNGALVNSTSVASAAAMRNTVDGNDIFIDGTWIAGNYYGKFERRSTGANLTCASP